MSSSSPEPLLVRLGVRYFRTLSGTDRPQAADAVHVLNPEERKALRRIERYAIVRAALAGAFSTIASATIELTVARPLLGPRPRHATLADQARFYAVVLGATAIASVLEILYLYWDGLRSVHRLSREAGLDLFAEQGDKSVAAAMARAALELPNPNAQLFGVDPRREASRARLLFASITYKLKVSATNFLAKALLRRALGRAFVRSWLPFVAVPFTALWNAIICWLIMREARIRAMGPSAVREMVDVALGSREAELSPSAKTSILSAVASAIVRTEDLHPNLANLFRHVAHRLGAALDPNERLTADDGFDLDDTHAFLGRLGRLEPEEQALVLRVLAIASIIDGRFTRAERRLLGEAFVVCGLPDDLSEVEALRKAFTSGDPLEPERIRALAARGSPRARAA